MDFNSKEISIHGQRAIGSDHTLCNYNNDPLKMIDTLLLDVKGEKINIINSDDIFVLGECNSVSVHSHVSGPQPTNKTVGKTIARIFTFHHFLFGGKIP